MRCLALAVALRVRGIEVAFICRRHEGHLCNLIESNGFSVDRLPPGNAEVKYGETTSPYAGWLRASWRDDAAQTIAAIRAMDSRPEWLIIDHYSLDCRWEAELRNDVAKIMVIDDLADRAHDCDLLLDQNLMGSMQARYAGKVPTGCVLLLGPMYALLQPLYAQLHESTVPRDGPIRRILVFFGGVDSANLTSLSIRAVLRLDISDVEVDVIVGGGNGRVQEVGKLIEGHGNFHLHRSLPSLAPLMIKADLAIGAGGTTNWERLCLGLPAVVITLSDNQRLITEELSQRNLVRWVGHRDQVDEAALVAVLCELIKSGTDKDWSLRCMSAVDGNGANRVYSAMMLAPTSPLRARVAGPGDEELLLNWANDPITRANAFCTPPIAATTHRSWFQGRLSNVHGCRIYIIETEEGLPLGQVRFDQCDEVWELDYAVAPAFRGRGLGRPLLDAALSGIRAVIGSGVIRGKVRRGNIPSRRVFESLGFEFSRGGTDSESVVYERPL
jgi:UDP-2,4-diacetamido-2,4,6-trideoxy-beta-L-altropyranose hydrolase